MNKTLKIPLGGLLQKIQIRTHDAALPVLLFLHGGPGVVNRHSIMTTHADLLDTFTLVGWDQRGTGGSFWGCKRETLTVSRLTDDAAELAEYLCKRFEKDKIFIIGGSWGSELGTYLAYRYPQRIAAYVGFGQVADGALNETLSYEFALNAAKEAGDAKSVKLLGEIAPPVDGVYDRGKYKDTVTGMLKQRKVMTKYGGYSPDAKKRGYWDAIVKPILFSGIYSPADLAGVILGYKRVLAAMWREVGRTKLAESCPRFEVPYFIFDGRFDNNTLAAFVEDYFCAIEAPRKELVWFENSGHNPMGDEPERFKKLLRENLGQVAIDLRAKGIRI